MIGRPEHQTPQDHEMVGAQCSTHEKEGKGLVGDKDSKHCERVPADIVGNAGDQPGRTKILVDPDWNRGDCHSVQAGLDDRFC